MTDSLLKDLFNLKVLSKEEQLELDIYHAGMKEHGAQGIGHIARNSDSKEAKQSAREKKEKNILDQVLQLILLENELKQQLIEITQRIEAIENVKRLFIDNQLDPLNPEHQYLMKKGRLDWDTLNSEGISYIDQQINYWLQEQQIVASELYDLKGEVDLNQITAEAIAELEKEKDGFLKTDKLIAESDIVQKTELLKGIDLSEEEKEAFLSLAEVGFSFENEFIASPEATTDDEKLQTSSLNDTIAAMPKP